MNNADTLRTFGRFSEPAMFILISLASGPKHGYAMMEDIARFADARPGAGTLYGAISRLEQHGLIAPLPSDDRRQPYRLTERGLQVLHSHLKSMQHLTDIALQRLGGTP